MLKRDDANIVANAAVVQYREITPDNMADFHFHGATEAFPLSAVIAVRHDDKSGVLLEGRYQSADSPVLVVRPAEVMDELLATVFTVRQYVLAAVALVGIATLATIALVFMLSIRLRRAEIRTMTRIGAAPRARRRHPGRRDHAGAGGQPAAGRSAHGAGRRLGRRIVPLAVVGAEPMSKALIVGMG